MRAEQPSPAQHPRGPVDAAGSDGPVDGANGRAAHQPLGRRQTDAAVHSPLENRAKGRPVFHSAHRPHLHEEVEER
jgi:hypothetical protein